MATIVTRSGKGSPLTHAEVDANFTNLNTDKLELSGGTMTGNLSFGDNDKAIFGAGSDLQIYHDGSHSYISDQGTGNLRVLATNFNVKDATGTRDLFYAQDGGLTKIYYNGLDRIETTSTGVDVTGTVTADGLTVENASGSTLTLSSTDATLVDNQVVGRIEFDGADGSGAGGGTKGSITVASADAQGFSYDMNFGVSDTSNNDVTRLTIGTTGDISFYEDTGTTAKFFWDASAESLGIGTTSPSDTLHVKSSAPVIRLEDSDNSAYVWQVGQNTDVFFINTETASDGSQFAMTSAGNVGIGTSTPTDFTGGRVTLEVYDTVGSYILSSDGTTVSRMGTEGGVGYLGTRTNHPLAITTNNTERMRIDSSGNVGIGTTSPTTPLAVHSDAGVVIKIDGDTANTSRTLLFRSVGTGEGIVQTDGNMHFLQEDASRYMRFSTANTERMRIDSSGNVGIGESSPDGKVHIRGGSGGGGALWIQTDGTFAGTDNASLNFRHYDDTGNPTAQIKALGTSNYTGDLVFSVRAGGTSGAGGAALNERMRIDSSGNVGIGTSSPSYKVHISTTDSTPLNVEHSDGSDVYIKLANNADGLGNFLGASSNNLTFWTENTERMRIDSSGFLLVGKTSTGIGTVGAELKSTGELLATVSGDACAFLNRTSSDGDIVQFRKDGTTVGSIVSGSGIRTMLNGFPGTHNGGTGMGFGYGTISGDPKFFPADGSYSTIDDVVDLGHSSARFDNIYATNGTIQTSDQNEKQQIASLTDAEITAAKAISKLFKTFKWNDSVAEKGDAARTHSGVIAQEVEQVMTDAGLNAGDYAFFISTTWWETQTEVPAVEAVEAVEATYDEEGNVLTEAVEAVEAQEAYIRTDTYHTAEEAPEGATERNRKGIRYPQLLSFIGAATEQRLASIETRLDALEA